MVSYNVISSFVLDYLKKSELTVMYNMLGLILIYHILFNFNYFQIQNLSRKSAVSQILEKKHTMVADQLLENSPSFCAKVYVSNLHPTVSKEDVMVIFNYSFLYLLLINGNNI